MPTNPYDTVDQDNPYDSIDASPMPKLSGRPLGVDLSQHRVVQPPRMVDTLYGQAYEPAVTEPLGTQDQLEQELAGQYDMMKRLEPRPDFMTQPFIPINEREARFPNSRISQAAASVFNRILKPGAEFIESPAGVGIAAASMFPPAIPVIGGAFTAEAIKATPEVARQAGTTFGDPASTFQQKSDAVADLAGVGLMGAAGGLGVAKAVPKPKLQTPVEVVRSGFDDAYNAYRQLDDVRPIDVETISVERVPNVSKLDAFIDATRKQYNDLRGRASSNPTEALAVGAANVSAEAIRSVRNGVREFSKFWESLPPEMKTIPKAVSSELFLGAARVVAEREPNTMQALDPAVWSSAVKSNAAVPGEQLAATLANKLGPQSFAWETINTPEFKTFMAEGKRTPLEVQTYIEKNAPKVHTRTYGMEGEETPAKKKRDQLTHEWLERLAPTEKFAVMRFVNSGDLLELKAYDKEFIDKATEFADATHLVEDDKMTGKGGPKATSYYNQVSAFPTEQYPVERVDVVLPLKDKTETGKQAKMLGEIFGQNEEIGKEANKIAGLLWRPDNLHENLPNTLGWAMAQYKELPGVGKVAYVNELQSRWGQEVRHHEQHARTRLKQDPKDKQWYVERYQNQLGFATPDEAVANYVKGANIPEHPLLSQWPRLTMKALIEQARKQGAKGIVLSDAESAMMTEGHDRVLQPPENALVPRAKIAQEPGMRLNYDQLYPRIMEELTGYKGQPVDMGEHKNAYQTLSPGNTPPDYTGSGYDRTKYRSDLIFRNPDGTPKTHATGLYYPIDKALSGGADVLTKQKALSKPPTEDWLVHEILKQNRETLRQADKSGPGGMGYRLREQHGLNPNESGHLDIEIIRNVANRIWQASKDGAENVAGFMRAGVPKLASEGPVGAYIARAINLNALLQTRMTGEFAYWPYTELNRLGLDKLELEQVGKYLWTRRHYAQRGEKPVKHQKLFDIPLNEKQQQFVKMHDDWTDHTLKEFNRWGMKIRTPSGGYRPMQRDVFYYPNMISPEIAQLLIDPAPRHRNKVEAYKKQWINHVMEIGARRSDSFELPKSYPEAEKAWNEYVQALGRDPSSRTHEDFQALHKVEGYGLPYEMIDKNPLKVVMRYGKRFAQDVAYHRAFEADPVARGILDIPDQYGKKNDNATTLPDGTPIGSGVHNKPLLNNIMRFQQHGHTRYEIRAESLMKLASVSLFSPKTPMRNIISQVAHVYDIPWQQLPTIVTSLPDIWNKRKQIIELGLRKGVIRPMASGGFMSQMTPMASEAGTRSWEMINSAANMISVVNLLQHGEVVSRMMSTAFAMQNMDLAVRAANKGSESAKQFLRGVAKNALKEAEVERLLRQGGKMDTALMEDLVASYVEQSQGTYDMRTVPPWMLQGWVAPFMPFAKWGGAMSNRLYDKAIRPAFKPEAGQPRNWKPLLTAVLGAVVSGAVIDELINHLMSGKQGYTPDIGEAMQGEEPVEDVTLKVMHMMELAGFAGEAGHMAGVALERMQGNQRAMYTWPLVDAGEDALRKLTFVADAINRGELPSEAMVGAIGDYLKEHIGLSREAISLHDRLFEPEAMQSKRDFRDFDVYNRVTDSPRDAGYVGDYAYGNPYYKQRANEFKRETDMERLPLLADELIADALRRSEGDPREFGKIMQSAMQDSQPSIPSPDSPDNTDFKKFGQWYVDTYGQQAWQQRFMRWQAEDQMIETRRNLLVAGLLKSYTESSVGLNHMLLSLPKETIQQLLSRGLLQQGAAAQGQPPQRGQANPYDVITTAP